MLTVGGVVSTGGGGGALFTVTVTSAEVVLLPAASRATAVRVCVPLLAEVVSQDTEYGAAVSSTPRLIPSSLNCTPTTPTLSEALAVTLVVPKTVAPEAGAVIFTVGGVVSAGGGGGGGGALFTVTVTGEEENLTPRISVATAVRVCEPLLVAVVFQETEYGAEVSRAPRLAPSSRNCTLETVREPTMLTLALTEVVPLTGEPEPGDVMVTIRLPPGSGGSNCARAWGAAEPTNTNRAAALASLTRNARMLLTIASPCFSRY